MSILLILFDMYNWSFVKASYTSFYTFPPLLPRTCSPCGLIFLPPFISWRERFEDRLCYYRIKQKSTISKERLSYPRPVLLLCDNLTGPDHIVVHAFFSLVGFFIIDFVSGIAVGTSRWLLLSGERESFLVA